MALERPYCTLEDVQKETRNDESGDTEWFERCINEASRWVDSFCKRDFWLHDHSEGNDPLRVRRSWVLGDSLYLPWPIQSVTKLWVWTDRLVGKTENDLWDGAEDYYVEPAFAGVSNSMIYAESGSFGDYPFTGNIEIEGVFGYTLEDEDPEEHPPTNLPPAIRRATTLVASAFSMRRHIEMVDMAGNRTEVLDSRIPPEARRLLGRHRDISHDV